MRQYDIFSGILLILSIIDFALAAPVPVREKRQACIDVVHIPRDAITVLGQRGGEDLDKFASLMEEYLKTSGKPVESSDAHGSSSLAPPGPDIGPTNVVQAPVPNPASSDAHGSSSLAPLGPDDRLTNVVQAPVPNPASSTANPNPLTEPSNPSLTTSPAQSDSEEYEWLYELEGHDAIHRLLNTPMSPEHGLEHELSPAPPGPDHGTTNVVQAPVPNPTSSTANPNPLMNPSSPSWPSPGSSEATLSDSEYPQMLYGIDELPGAHAPQPNPKKRPWTDMAPDPGFDWDHWMGIVNQPSPPKEFGQAYEYQVKHVQQPDPVPSTESDLDRINFPEPVSEVHPPSMPMSAGLPAGPEHKEVTPPVPGAGSPTVPEHEEATPPSLDLGPLEEPENEVIPGPPSTPESTDPEHHSDPQPLSAAVQPEDLKAAIYGSLELQAALYAEKDKVKEWRRVSGLARDVGNAAQKELLPDGRSLDPGE
jgi:hypothetical protein